MVSDGIKALSRGHSRCSEPRPLVALHGQRAVISIPHCQRAPPPLPKILSICRISGADGVQGMHFSAIHCCALTRPANGIVGSSCQNLYWLQSTHGHMEFLFMSAKKYCFCHIIRLIVTYLTVRHQVFLPPP